ncbi:ribonuclease H-like domain-containing protein [Tanacetum coccineum]
MSTSTSAARNKTELLLNQLDLRIMGTIVVMVCRMWDVYAATGRYLSVSDAKGDFMHCTAKGNIAHNFLRLKEWAIYSVKNFTIVPNKDEFRVIRFAELMLEFDGETTVQKSFMKSDGFTRYQFQLVEIDAIEPTNNIYLIDVAGYVTNVGRTTQTRTGSKTLDFYLANCSGLYLKPANMSTSTSAARNKTELLLNQLDLGVMGTIVVMVYRMWDVYAATGRYLSVSDAKGDFMHCTAKGNIAHNFLRLKEWAIYSVKNFTVVPNKDEFRVIRFAELMLEFDGETTVQKSFMKSDGFTRYQFQLVEIDAIEPTNNIYLIDVAGYVTNVGRTTQTWTSLKTLDFYLANCRGQQIRVTLWGGLGDMLIQRGPAMWDYKVTIASITVKLMAAQAKTVQEKTKMFGRHAATARYLASDTDAKGEKNGRFTREELYYVVPNRMSSCDKICLFQLVEIDAIEPTNNIYLIDVAGYVTNVGRTTQTWTSSKTLDFYLANCSRVSEAVGIKRLYEDLRVTAVQEVILNGNKVLKKTIREVEQIYEPTSTEEKQDRRNEMKARGTLLMALPNKDQLKFHSYKDEKLLIEAIEKRYRGNKESKKAQRILLKQQYENFGGLSTKTIDQTFDRLQKLIGQLERNKEEIETIILDDLYNNLKIYKPELSGSSSTSQNLQNVAFVSSNSSNSTNITDEANNTTYEVSAAHNQGNDVNSTSVDNLSDDVICAFLVSHSNSPQLAQEDLEQIDPDDLEEMDLQWEMAMLTIRARRFIKRTRRKLDINGQIIRFDMSKMECYNCHKNRHFARECRALKNQENKRRENDKRNITIETPTENALIAQDRIRGYDWSYQAEEEHLKNFALMAYTSSGSSSSSDSEVDSCSKSCVKAYATLKEQYDTTSVVESFVKSSEMELHAPKPDLMFIDEQVESESVDVVSNVASSDVNTVESKLKTVDKGVFNTVETNTVRKNSFGPPIIED